MGPGRGLFHVHSSADPDFVFSRFAARHPGHEILGCPGPSTAHRSHALAFAIFPGRCGCGPCRIFYSSGFAQSAVSMALSRHSPFFEGARLDRGLALPLCGRHTCPRIYPGSHDDWIFTNDHPGLFGFRHSSCYLDSLQFPSQRQMARKVSGHAQIPSLAPYVSKRIHRQEFRNPFSVD